MITLLASHPDAQRTWLCTHKAALQLAEIRNVRSDTLFHGSTTLGTQMLRQHRPWLQTKDLDKQRRKNKEK